MRLMKKDCVGDVHGVGEIDDDDYYYYDDGDDDYDGGDGGDDDNDDGVGKMVQKM